MKKSKSFQMEEIESYGKYFRFKLTDKEQGQTDDWHYLPKEYFPEKVLVKYDPEDPENYAYDIPTQLTILTLITDDCFDITDNPFGEEADELRERFSDLAEKINDESDPEEIADQINRILEDVDARDGLFFLENQQPKKKKCLNCDCGVKKVAKKKKA